VPHTLLLADDSVTIQRVIELTFADEDVNVVAVSTGDQAIERLEASPPDIVLADIGMPGKNGYEVAQYMRRSPKLAHIPVVLLTGAFEPVDQARAAEAGCDGVLAKPFEPQLVIGRVKELLARVGRPETLSADTEPPAPADHWAPPLADQSRAEAQAAPPSQGQPLDDYFDRLDAAFSNVSTAPGAPVASGPKPSPPPLGPAAVPASPTADTVIDWFNKVPSGGGAAADQWDFPVAAPSAESLDLPLSYSSSSLATPVEVAAPLAAVPPSAPVESSAPIAAFEPVAASAPPAAFRLVAAPAPIAPIAPVKASPVELPSLADAFAALLAFEHNEPAPAVSPAWPTRPPPAAAITDELVEDVTRRVLDRLTDQVVRDTVGDIVSKVAERLVREEIERIRASLK